MNLIEVKTDTREAVFENLESPTQETTTVKVGQLRQCSFPSFYAKKMQLSMEKYNIGFSQILVMYLAWYFDPLPMVYRTPHLKSSKTTMEY